MRNRYGFRRTPRQVEAVTQHPLTAKKAAICRACSKRINAGETVVVVRLKKRFKVPCSSCNHTPATQKKYCPTCVPPDLNRAMGFNPNAHMPGAHQHAAAAPLKPPAQADLDTTALAALQTALLARLQAKYGRQVPDAIKKDFETYKKLLARAARPGTPEEGDVAMNVALQRLVKLAFQ